MEKIKLPAESRLILTFQDFPISVEMLHNSQILSFGLAVVNFDLEAYPFHIITYTLEISPCPRDFKVESRTNGFHFFTRAVSALYYFLEELEQTACVRLPVYTRYRNLPAEVTFKQTGTACKVILIFLFKHSYLPTI
ncbi:predicted protein [Methanosarcina acetivorans C2A]|uniref:Uncharacterized protein n=1 Tax=Methanosarcina acetivorans (strain ATCC 35395 / DSM 2834 / JCM 12185 / C2A) TaxID=188937 RepID=Q8TRC7_METAC|nr:predicted protein [Methanosarcina acetivorans C2A]